MKILALDIGDKWIGSAISDPLGITARPYTTVDTENLVQFLTETIEQEQINTIVLGYPKTLKGKESEQTRKTKAVGDNLKKLFPQINWEWWDERLTSKQAERLIRPKSKQDKLASHSVAAALLLMGYLEYLSLQA